MRSICTSQTPNLLLFHCLTKKLQSARKGASHIILACRSTSKGEKAKEIILHDTKCESQTTISVWPLDLANYASVLYFGERVRTQLPRLDAFIANAGMEIQEYRKAEDLEIHLTVNVVSTFLCVLAVLPKLRETAAREGDATTVTICGSMYHIFGPDAEFNAGMGKDVDMFDALSSPDTEKTDIVWRYALSKLMVHQCFHGLVDALAKSAGGQGVAFHLVNPGWCGTELSRAKVAGVVEKVCFALMGWTAEKGSRMYVYAMAEGSKNSGKYLSECHPKIESRYVRSDRGREIQKKMWGDLMKRIEGISTEVAGFIR